MKHESDGHEAKTRRLLGHTIKSRPEATIRAIGIALETEARLRERAARDGQNADSLANVLLADALADDPDALTAEEIAQIRVGIRRGLEAAGAGRERSVDEYAAEIERRQTVSETVSTAERRERGG